MLKNFFSYKGRMGRKKYFFTSVTALILTILISIAVVVGAIAIMRYVFKVPVGVFFLFEIALLIVVLLCAILMWTIFSFPVVKRLHDMQFSGWWFFLLVLLGPVYIFFRKIYLNDLRIIELELLTSIITFIVLLILFLKKGTKGPNKYGPDPVATPLETNNSSLDKK